MRVVSVPMAELMGLLEVIWLEGDAFEVLLKERNLVSRPLLEKKRVFIDEHIQILSSLLFTARSPNPPPLSLFQSSMYPSLRREFPGTNFFLVSPPFLISTLFFFLEERFFLSKHTYISILFSTISSFLSLSPFNTTFSLSIPTHLFHPLLLYKIPNPNPFFTLS